MQPAGFEREREREREEKRDNGMTLPLDAVWMDERQLGE